MRFSAVYGILSATNTAARVRQGEDGNVSMGVYRRGSNCAESRGGNSGERAFRSRGIFAHARAGGGVRAKVRRARMRELGRTLAQRGGRRLYRNAARVALSVSDGVHRGGHARTLRKGFYRQRGAPSVLRGRGAFSSWKGCGRAFCPSSARCKIALPRARSGKYNRYRWNFPRVFPPRAKGVRSGCSARRTQAERF